MSRLRPVLNRTRLTTLVLLIAIGWFAIQWLSPSAYGAQLGNRELLLSTNKSGAIANYLLSFKISTAGMLGSIDLSFCSNSPFPTDPCNAPVGFSASGAVLSAQTGVTGFSINPASTSNDIKLVRPPSAAAVVASSYDFTNVINPTLGGSYFVRIQTFASNDTSGPASDYGGVAFSINGEISISAEVPPYLTFCAATIINGMDCSNAVGQYANFGELSSLNTNTATSQLLVATNALYGYTVTLFGPTMASGLNSINQLSVSDVSRPGTSQFGMNLRANTAPAVGTDPIGPGGGQPSASYNTPDMFHFASGDSLISTPTTDITRKYTASYIVNVPSNQSPGIYVTTLTYVCLAKF